VDGRQSVESLESRTRYGDAIVWLGVLGGRLEYYYRAKRTQNSVFLLRPFIINASSHRPLANISMN
jgi:hypothetical protein